MNENDFIGNEIRFPVPEKKFRTPHPRKRNYFRIFLTGYGVILGVGLGIRCLFFINACFADGEVQRFNHRFVKRNIYSASAVILFHTKDGREVFFEGTRNLRLEQGEKVKVLYKKNQPQRAVVFSFFGFWFNTILICQLALLFWVGFLLAYYGYDY